MKYWATFVLALVLFADALTLTKPVQAGRTAYEASGTVIKIEDTDGGWLNGESHDVFLRGDNGKLFMLHFHGANPLGGVEGKHVSLVYIQQTSSCQTGYKDKIQSASWN